LTPAIADSEGGGVVGRLEWLTAGGLLASFGCLSRSSSGAEKLNRIGDDLDRLSLFSRLAGPLSPLESSVDRYGTSLR
jgi:hypothetical protein